MIEPDHPRLSIVRQCALVSIARSSHYYTSTGESALNLELMRLIDEQYLSTPWYGARQMARHLRRQGYTVGRTRIRRLMRQMGLTAIYRKPNTSQPHPEHRIYPYLLRDVRVDRPNHAWCADITYSAPRSWRHPGRCCQDSSMHGIHPHWPRDGPRRMSASFYEEARAETAVTCRTLTG